MFNINHIIFLYDTNNLLEKINIKNLNIIDY